MKKTLTGFSTLKFMLTGLLLTAIAVFSYNFTLGSGYTIGDKAQDFNLKNVNGKNVSLAGDQRRQRVYRCLYLQSVSLCKSVRTAHNGAGSAIRAAGLSRGGDQFQ